MAQQQQQPATGFGFLFSLPLEFFETARPLGHEDETHNDGEAAPAAALDDAAESSRCAKGVWRCILFCWCAPSLFVRHLNERATPPISFAHYPLCC